MDPLGIYFGPTAIDIVELKGKKIINHIQLSYPETPPSESPERITDELKLVALLKEEFRKNKIEAKEASVCLSGKDVLVRTFEMPALAPLELQTAVNFEAKKYIPFKIEELVSDFQFNLDRTVNRNQTVYAAIKKDILNKYISIFNQLDIKISLLEHSAFSVIRFLKSAGLTNKGIVAIISVDYSDEANFIVLDNGFALFNRDITVAKGPEEIPAEERATFASTLEKIKTELRVSLDFYNRKFPNKSIQKVFLLCPPDFSSDLEAFLKDLDLSFQPVDVSKHIEKDTPFSLTFVKSYGCALSKTVKTPIKIDLFAAKEKSKAPAAAINIQTQLVSLVKTIKIEPRFVIIGLLICIASYLFGTYRIAPLKKEIVSIISMRPQVYTVNPNASYDELAAKDSEYKEKLAVMDKLLKKQFYLTKPLNLIPKLIPDGVWVTNLSLTKPEEGKVELSLSGTAYLGDRDKEFKQIDKFVTNLKEDPDFSKQFKNIIIESIENVVLEQNRVTNFLIRCQN